MLARAQDADFGNGRKMIPRQNAFCIDAVFFAKREEALAVFVVSAHTEKGNAGGKGGQICCGVGGTAQDGALTGHPIDGDGSFGGDAADVAENVTVEHDVADDCDGKGRECLRQKFRYGLFHGISFLYVETEIGDVAVLDFVFFSFDAEEAFFADARITAAGE